ncbi:MAG: hypothetical protein ABSF74_10145 [Dehalococcoidia bacterium]
MPANEKQFGTNMDWITACEIIEVSPDATDAQIKERRSYWSFLLAPDATVGKPEHIRKKAETEYIKKKDAWEYLLIPENRPKSRSSGRRPAAKPQNEPSPSVKAKPILSITPKHIRFKELGNLETKTTYFEISNIGGPYTDYSISGDHIPKWLEIIEIKRLSHQALPVQVHIKATGQQVGFKYECQIPIKIEDKNSGYFDEGRIQIELVMKERFIQVDKKTVQFSVTPGAMPPPQTVILTNGGIGFIEGDIVPRQPWIKIGTRHIRFNNTYKMQVQVDTSKLSMENTGFIDINTNGGTDNIMVKVLLLPQPIKTTQTNRPTEPTIAHKCAKDTVWYNPRLQVYECRACLRRSKHRNNIIK